MIINRILILTLSFLTVNMAFAVGLAPAPTSSLVVDVRNTGATGNGSTDDTTAIQAAIDQVSGTGGTVLVPAGTYLVTHSGAWPYPALTLKSNMTFKMDPGAIIKLTPTDHGGYVVLYIVSATNVNVVGGTVQGERHQHIPTTYDFANVLDAQGLNPGGEWGYGVWVDAESSNVYIEGVTSREMWGDGFSIGGANGGINHNVNFYSVLAEDNRRQGISIAEADGVVVSDSTFSNTNGAWPKSGIDIEPLGIQTVNNVQILNNKFISNSSCGVLLIGKIGGVNNIIVNNNNFVNNGLQALLWANPGIGSSYSGNMFSGNGLDIGFSQ